MMSAQMGGRKVVSVGNYKFTGKRLGKGNFAIVEEAVHSTLNLKVAVKIMDINEIKEDYVIRNLYREAKILSKLSHPSIASLFQTMQHGNMYYLVMEMVGGGDLCNFIRAQRNGRLEEHCTRLFARQLISAISHMHNLGIVHRDLKMENIMLSATSDRIKIVDFGLSNLFTGSRLLHTHCGSPEYAAPELFIEGKPYGPEVDLWSLGVILYGMAVGQLPFVSSSRDCAAATQRRNKLLEQINKGMSAPHRKALALFSTDFKAMMSKLLVVDSAKRINITELIFHPWITEKGRKAIRSNPLKKLDDRARFDIIRDVAIASDVKWQDVQRALHMEPQGNYAGAFNLLAYRALRQHLEGEVLPAKGAAPNSARPAVENSRCTKLRTLAAKRQDTARSSTQASKPKSPEVRKPDTAKPSTSASKYVDSPRCFGDVALRRHLAPKRPIMATDNTLKVRKGSEPENLLYTCSSGSGHPPVLATRGTSTARQQEDAAAVASHNRTNHMRSPAGDAARDNTQCMFNDFMINSAPSQNTRSHKTKINAMIQQQQVYANPRYNNILKTTPRTFSATMKPPENRLSTNNRPLTTGPLTTTISRSVKRRSMLPVLQMNKTTASATSALRKNVPAKSRLHQITKSAPLERSDDFKRTSNGGITRKLDLSNEPIARSIAGYMTRNINKNKVESLKWIKGASANYSRTSTHK